MKPHRPLVALLGLLASGLSPVAAREPDLVSRARAVLQTHCQRCHGPQGTARGGFDYLLDRDRLVSRQKVVPGKPAASELYQRVIKGEMPPAKHRRPSADEVAVLRRWIEADAPAFDAVPPRKFLADEDVQRLVRGDLRKLPERHRPFQRYFTFTHLHNSGMSTADVETHRQALAKLVNTLSWHPRISRPRPIDADKTVFRIDLRHYKWSARTWERLVNASPYRPAANDGDVILLRGDWFIATASRGKLYYDVLELPASDRALERLLQVDVSGNLREETAARAGFNDSGVSKNNRVIERHDAVSGAYWRSYDFSDSKDRQNIFQHPLGPAAGRTSFRHAGGEAIFHLPNGLHGYLLMDSSGRRVEKAPVEIVSDPRRPDRQVEVGVSCMSCHAHGLIAKEDQVRAHVEKNRRAFRAADVEAVQALYPPAADLRALLDDDNQRYLGALKKAGVSTTADDPVTAVTLRYEATIDLRSSAAEFGLTADEFTARLGRAAELKRTLGPLLARGGTVKREVFEESFVKALRRLRPDAVAARTDTSRSATPFTGHTDTVLAVALSADGRLALSGGEDHTVRLWDVRTGAAVRIFKGHTRPVHALAFSDDGRRALSGSADRTVRLWDVDTGKELRTFEGPTDAVRCVAFSPDGRFAVSGGDDKALSLWNLATGARAQVLSGHLGSVRTVSFSPDGRWLLSGGLDGAVRRWDAKTGKALSTWSAHPRGVYSVAIAPDGRTAASGGADRVVRLWDLKTGKELRTLSGHANSVLRVAFLVEGDKFISGSSRHDSPDRVVRLWDVATGKQLGSRSMDSPVWCVAFADDGTALLGGPDKILRLSK